MRGAGRKAAVVIVGFVKAEVEFDGEGVGEESRIWRVDWAEEGV